MSVKYKRVIGRISKVEHLVTRYLVNHFINTSGRARHDETIATIFLREQDCVEGQWTIKLLPVDTERL